MTQPETLSFFMIQFEKRTRRQAHVIFSTLSSTPMWCVCLDSYCCGPSSYTHRPLNKHCFLCAVCVHGCPPLWALLVHLQCFRMSPNSSSSVQTS
ncbi:hypothetical protein M404DRAFT_759893 [Pisolithus tinctorius Marx 270]|uniref:Uncharacterized protein n=1 Tax=Pisolithus tinctorius Marx 270 TaxID=870435 RepID=A0A0C3NZL3_PISTI|nr:hypothetical protein M404DRAFT_759893 [Pisolithus tinctorius Marx 270]